MESGKSQFDAFNVCTGKITTVKDLADTVIDLFGASSKATQFPTIVNIANTVSHLLLQTCNHDLNLEGGSWTCPRWRYQEKCLQPCESKEGAWL